jgi:hypothetical protein
MEVLIGTDCRLLIQLKRPMCRQQSFLWDHFFVDILGDTLWKLLEHPFFAALNFFWRLGQLSDFGN